MTRSDQLLFCLAALLVFPAFAQPLSPVTLAQSNPGITNIFPPLPQSTSPVDFFRQLLDKSPDACAAALTNRPPAARERILAKVREYQALDPNEREQRLRATELRWWLTPLLHLPMAERDKRLAEVPASLRELVRSRLAQWDILPAQLQQEFLANEKAVHYFAHVEENTRAASDAPSRQFAEQFNHFFELTPAERRQTLGRLTAEERQQMEQTMKSFEALPPPQRFQCLRNYARFAGMTAAARSEFLKNAESWSKLSPRERQAWRDLVAHVPEWPPMPPAIVPSALMPQPAPALRPNMATNFK
ncbi:MAG: DUF3106 domain-containing protein [Verrucomicrobiota bacterium]